MFLSKYGVARHIRIPVPKAGSAAHAVSADWTPAAGDVKISKDGGTAANVTNLPTAIAMGNSALWDFSLTATEMEAAQVNVTVADSATKAVDDTGFVIETYGHASAQHAFDLGTAAHVQEGFKKNTAFNNFEFEMIDSSNHLSEKTGLTVSAERSIDGGAYASCTNSPAEVGNGTYKINLSAADLNGSSITLRFTATGADVTKITIKTSD